MQRLKNIKTFRTVVQARASPILHGQPPATTNNDHRQTNKPDMPNHSASGLRRPCSNGLLRRGFLPQRHDDTTTKDSQGGSGGNGGRKGRRIFTTKARRHEGRDDDGISHREHGAAAARGDERRFLPRSCEVAKKYLCRQDACGTRSVTQASRLHRFICAKDPCNVNIDVYI